MGVSGPLFRLSGPRTSRLRSLLRHTRQLDQPPRSHPAGSVNESFPSAVFNERPQTLFVPLTELDRNLSYVSGEAGLAVCCDRPGSARDMRIGLLV
jgi:hypothetical protein